MSIRLHRSPTHTATGGPHNRAICARVHGRPSRQAGTAEILQMAIIVPIAMTLLLAILEFSLALSTRSIITNASRVAVREAIRSTATDPIAENRIKLLAGQAANGLLGTTPPVTITPSNWASGASGTAVTVTINYNYQLNFLGTRVSMTQFVWSLATTMSVP